MKIVIVKKCLFVSGNICRSPIAEAVFLNLIKERGLESKWGVDSAALGGWHAGKSPDRRAMSTLRKHNVPYEHKARQIKKDDFKKFDYIFGMDDENMEELERLAPKDKKAQLLLLGSFDPQGDRIIRDPYYVSIQIKVIQTFNLDLLSGVIRKWNVRKG